MDTELHAIRVSEIKQYRIISTKKENVLLGILTAKGIFHKFTMSDISPEQQKEITKIQSDEYSENFRKFKGLVQHDVGRGADELRR